jgi:magnesium transporter
MLVLPSYDINIFSVALNFLVYRIWKKLLKDTEIYAPETLDETDSWIELTAPDTKDLLELEKKFSIPSDFLNAGLDMDERPRIEMEDGVKLIIIRVPLFIEDEKGSRYTTRPVGVIVTKSHIITVCLLENPVLKHFFTPKAKAFSTAKRTRFIFQMLEVANRHFSKYLDKIEEDITTIEAVVRKSMENRAIMHLLSLQKSLTYFNNAISANRSVIDTLMKGRVLDTYEEDQDLMEEVVVENEQVHATVQILADVLNNTMDAYASIISNNLNVVIKFLASVTIIVTIPTIFSSFYGMNVSLPGAGDPNFFSTLVIMTTLITVILAIIFWKKRWL